MNLINEENRRLLIEEGLLLSLQAEQLGSLNVGAPILYKQLRVGEVIAVKLSQDSQSIAIEGQIYPSYEHLITTESQFYNASGVKIDAGLFSGVQISTQTIASIMDGGIELVTNVDAGPVAGGHVFQLYESAP